VSLPMLTEFRQSTLRAHATCPRRTRAELEAGDITTGWSEASADLGTVVHAILAEIMATLARLGEKQMPTEEATVIAWEVYNALPVTLPAKELADMEWMVQSFCKYQWRPERTLAIEEPIRVELVCDDGEVRTVKGQPDLVIADPPRGLVCVDHKTGMARPKAPRQVPEDATAVEGKQYLSDVGLFQRQVYGLLLLHRYPSAGYVTLRELALRYPDEPPREASLFREELEHVEKAVRSRMMKLDRALREGPDSELWSPRAGKHCRRCPVGRSCPVPPEMRGDGVIGSQEDADAAAHQFSVAGAQADQAREQSKVWVEAGHAPGRANEREELRWGPEPDAWKRKGGGRKFGLWPVVESISSDERAA
jgi:hypothetical protein